MQKGMSLAIETTVVIVIAIIVLVALLMFFSGSWGQGVDQIRLQQQKVELCSKYVSQDTECKGTSLGTAIKKDDFDKMCKGLGLPTNPQVCCAAYCPQGVKCELQITAKEQYRCTPTGCTEAGDQKADGVCETLGTICCKSPASSGV